MLLTSLCIFLYWKLKHDICQRLNDATISSWGNNWIHWNWFFYICMRHWNDVDSIFGQNLLIFRKTDEQYGYCFNFIKHLRVLLHSVCMTLFVPATQHEWYLYLVFLFSHCLQAIQRITVINIHLLRIIRQPDAFFLNKIKSIVKMRQRIWHISISQELCNWRAKRY